MEPHPIAAYLRRHKLSRAAFAALIGVSAGAISHYVTGRKKVGPARAVEIERVTNGALTRRQLRPDLFGKRPS